MANGKGAPLQHKVLVNCAKYVGGLKRDLFLEGASFVFLPSNAELFNKEEHPTVTVAFVVTTEGFVYGGSSTCSPLDRHDDKDGANKALGAARKSAVSDGEPPLTRLALEGRSRKEVRLQLKPLARLKKLEALRTYYEGKVALIDRKIQHQQKKEN